jgi:hypothetical protein
LDKADEYSDSLANLWDNPQATSADDSIFLQEYFATPIPFQMSLVSGPGRAGGNALPDELQLVIEPHVKYIQSLDTVRLLPTSSPISLTTGREKTSLNTGLLNIFDSMVYTGV